MFYVSMILYHLSLLNTPKFSMTYLLLVLALNLGIESTATSQSIQVDLKVFLEGPYDRSSGKMSTKLYDLGYLPGMKPKTFLAKPVPLHDPYADLVQNKANNNKSQPSNAYPDGSVDWVHVTIKEYESGTPVFQSTQLLMNDGSVRIKAIEDVALRSDISYVIIMAHRNHLPVESSEIKLIGNKLAYDFTSSTEAVGLKSIGKVKAMFAGNIHQSNNKSTSASINAEDISLWRKANGQNSSYLLEDVDMNGDISVHDQSIILENLDISSSVRLHE